MSNAFNLSQLANNTNSSGQVALGTGVSGTLPIANGGTNNGSLAVTAGGVVYTDGSKLVNVGAGTSGQVLQSNGASAPTWATASGGGLGGITVFTASGTFTIPTGKTVVKVTVVGSGGGGGGSNGAGGSGGTSSVASGTQTITTISATGGSGGSTTQNQPPASSGGSGSNGDVNMTGSPGLITSLYDMGCASNTATNTGGMTIYQSYGSGGSGYTSGSGGVSTTSGGSGGSAIKYLTGLTPGNTLTVTRGAAGTAPSGGSAGNTGIITFEY